MEVLEEKQNVLGTHVPINAVEHGLEEVGWLNRNGYSSTLPRTLCPKNRKVEMDSILDQFEAEVAGRNVLQKGLEQKKQAIKNATNKNKKRRIVSC